MDKLKFLSFLSDAGLCNIKLSNKTILFQYKRILQLVNGRTLNNEKSYELIKLN